LLLRVTDATCGAIRVGVSTGGAVERGVQFRTHPNVDRTLFSMENKIGLKDVTKPFPTTAVNPLAVLRWRYVSTDESAAPLLINCWPSDAGHESTVNIEYELGNSSAVPAARELRNVVISIPTGGASGGQPTVAQVDGEFVYNSRAGCVEWHLPVIDASNPSGSLEFSTGAVPADSFFPVSVSFVSKHTYAEVAVTTVAANATQTPVDFVFDSSLVPESFTIV
jgi:coatomer subunit delta